MTDPAQVVPEKVKASEFAELKRKAKAYDEGQVSGGVGMVEKDADLMVKVAKLESEIERLKERKAEGSGDLAKELNAKWDKLEGELEALRTQLALAAAGPKKEDSGKKKTEKEERATCAKCEATLKIPAGSEIAGEYECPGCGAPLSLEA
jgi:outer membrane murein-binding lipoprotein Lpp